MHFTTESKIALVVYLVIVARWFMVINKYHADVLANDMSYEYKDHPVFKGILCARALVLAAVAPLVAFIKPSYFSQFFDGVKVEGRRAIVSNLIVPRRAVK